MTCQLRLAPLFILLAAATAHAAVPQPGTWVNRVTPHWTADGTAFWYADQGIDGRRTFWWVDAAGRRREPAFDVAGLAVTLTAANLWRGGDPAAVSIDDIGRTADGGLTLVVDGLDVTVD